jgi:hypothetical protein
MDNIDPALWGGDGWRFLHTLAKAYPVSPDGQTRREMFRLLTALETLLPCAQCREHFRQYMSETKVQSSESRPLLSRVSLRAWMDAAHLHANKHRDARLARGVDRPDGAEAAKRPDQPAQASGGAVAPRRPTAVAPRRPTAVTPRRPTAGPAGPAVDRGPAVDDPVTQADQQRRRALLGCFGVVAIVLLAVLIAFIAVTSQRGSCRAPRPDRRSAVMV